MISSSQTLLTIAIPYLPLPFVITLVYTLMVVWAPYPEVQRVRRLVLQLLIWFNLVGIPMLFVLCHVLFSNYLSNSDIALHAKLVSDTNPTGLLSPTFHSFVVNFEPIRLGFLLGAISSSPVLMLSIKREERALS